MTVLTFISAFGSLFKSVYVGIWISSWNGRAAGAADSSEGIGNSSLCVTGSVCGVCLGASAWLFVAGCRYFDGGVILADNCFNVLGITGCLKVDVGLCKREVMPIFEVADTPSMYLEKLAVRGLNWVSERLDVLKEASHHFLKKERPAIFLVDQVLDCVHCSLWILVFYSLTWCKCS